MSTLAQVAHDVGGVLHGGPNESDVEVRGAGIDSRSLLPQQLFIALPGEHTDGHAYVDIALRAGAAGSLVTRPVPGPYIEVEEVATGLTRWATAHRGRLAAHVVGVTGSAGKTGTKDLLAAVLGAAGPVVATPGSYNNDLGVPLTVLAAGRATAHLVLEMGARAVGDIARLCTVGRPHTGVVLNIGSAHLGEFGSRENIAAAKGELIERATELAVLNADDPLVAAMAPRARRAVRTFGTAGDVRAEDIALDDHGRARFVLRSDEGHADVRLRLVGAHHVANALAAATVGIARGLTPEAVAAALASADAVSRWRMEVRERPDGVTIVNDAYNANPESVRAALDTLQVLAASRSRSWAVLGPMLELGDASAAEHRRIGAHSVGRADRLVAVGAPEIAAGAGDSAVAAEDIAAAVAFLDGQLEAGDVVLVKASRGAGLERLAAALLDPVRDTAAMPERETGREVRP